MIQHLLEASKLLKGTLRTSVVACVVVSGVVAALVAYDNVAHDRRLSSLERAAALMREGTVFSGHGGDMGEMGEHLIRESMAIIDAVGELPSPHSRYLKFACAFAPWLLLSLVYLAQRESHWMGAIEPMIRMWLFGACFALVGAFLPDARSRWVHFVVYPLGHFLIVVTIVILSALDDLDSPENWEPRDEGAP